MTKTTTLIRQIFIDFAFFELVTISVLMKLKAGRNQRYL